MSNQRSSHGITCSCARCVGLRRYPQPSMCDWCKTVHAGDAASCPGTFQANEIDWSEEDPAIDEMVNFIKTSVSFTTRTIKERMNGKIHRNNRTSRWEFPWVGILEKGSSHRGSNKRNVSDIGWTELLSSFEQTGKDQREK